jgi:REP element-mobilizing transposase RayT
MARPIRIEFAGAMYHVTSRGNRQEAIYIDDEDRLNFLSLLSQVSKDYNWLIHAYCLMDNHYHLLIETQDGNLSRGMRQLNGVYTQKTNRHHGKVGHVFQGRYKAILVQKETYLLELSRYIVLNPVRAGMVREAKDWPWSSYQQTAGIKTANSWLSIEWVLSAFGKNLGTAQEKYRQFISEGKNQPAPWESLKNQVFLGSEVYVKEIFKKIDLKKDLSETPKSQRKEKAKILSWYEEQSETRNEGIKSAYDSGGYSMKEIGSYYHLHYSRVSRIIAQQRKAKDKT